jgi:hypothetical protein
LIQFFFLKELKKMKIKGKIGKTGGGGGKNSRLR